MKKALPSIIWLAAALLLGALGYWFGRDSSHTAEPAAEEETKAVATVQVATVGNGSIQNSATALGSVRPIPGSAVYVSIPFESQIEQLLAAAGQHVTAGTPLLLARSTPDAQLQFRQATDALAAAERNLDQVKKRLADQLATNSDVSAAELARQSAQTQVQSLRDRGIEEHREEHRPVLAAVSGIVAAVNVQCGQVAPPGSPLLVINPDSSRAVVAGVDPADAAEIKPGQAVAISVLQQDADAPGLTGKLLSLSSVVDPQSRNLDAVISLPVDCSLPFNTDVLARFPTDAVTGLLVPKSAVLPDDQDQVVFTVNQGKASRHVVKLAASDHESAIIVSADIHAGDSVVISGNAELEDGMAVAIAPADSPATGPTTAAATTDTPATAPAPTTTEAKR